MNDRAPGKTRVPGSRGGLVSVVIPCCDCEAYVGQAIESVLGQSWPPLELIVVDDGSRDGSEKVVRSFGEAVRLVKIPHGGAGAARNAGAVLARGDYVAFLDADDLWPGDSLQVRLEAFLRDPGLDMVFGMTAQFISPELDAATRSRIVCPGEPVMVRLPGTVLLSRKAFDRVGGFATDVAVGEGLDWIMRCAELGLHGGTVRSVVLRRRLHAVNLGKPRSTRKDYLKVVRAALERRRTASRAGRMEEPRE